MFMAENLTRKSESNEASPKPQRDFGCQFSPGWQHLRTAAGH